MREQWPGKMAEYNCYCSNQSFSGLITSPFQDYQIFQKTINQLCLFQITQPFPNISPPTKKQTNPMHNISPTKNRQMAAMPNISLPTKKQTSPMHNISPTKSKRNAKQKSPNQETDKPNAQHNLLNGINIAYILKATP